MRSHRLLVPLLALALSATACAGDHRAAPPAPTGPEVFVAVRNGTLVRFELNGPAAGPVTELPLPETEGWYVPVDGRGGKVTVTRFTEGGMESITHSVGVVDARTGDVEGLGPDGPAAGLLLSPDGRDRYELISPDSGFVTSVDRVDADGGNRRTVVPDVNPDDDSVFNSTALSPDGRTLYLVRAPWEGQTTVLAADVDGDRTRTIDVGVEQRIINAIVSPDGRTLALTVDAGRTEHGRTRRVALVPAGGGTPRWVDAPDAAATTFTRAGDVVLVVGYDDNPSLALADAATGAVRPVAGTEGMGVAVSAD